MGGEPRKPTLIESMACGGLAAAFAVNFTHPIELVKTRMQASGGSVGGTVSAVMKNEGLLSFWKGLPFAYGRELSYTSIKLGACKLYFIMFVHMICTFFATEDSALYLYCNGYCCILYSCFILIYV